MVTVHRAHHIAIENHIKILPPLTSRFGQFRRARFEIIIKPNYKTTPRRHATLIITATQALNTSDHTTMTI